MIGSIPIRRNVCTLWIVREPPFPTETVSSLHAQVAGYPYHLERVQLFLDLLRKHWCQPIAGGNLSTTVIICAWPRIMELNARTETDVARCKTAWGPRNAFRIRSGESRHRHEVVLTFNGDRIGVAFRTVAILICWGARRARDGRICEARYLREGEALSQIVYRALNR